MVLVYQRGCVRQSSSISQFQRADDDRRLGLVMQCCFGDEVESWKRVVLGLVSFRLCGSATAGPRDGVFGRGWTHVLLRSVSLGNMRRRRCAGDMQRQD